MLRVRAALAAAAIILALGPSPAQADGCAHCAPSVTTEAATVQGAPNQANIDQRGGPHRAGAIQRGAANWIGLAQQGRGHSASVAQTGDNNTAIVRQFGRNNTASVTQTGSNNAACVIQVGRNASTEFAQSGGQSAGIIQTPRGTREVPVEVCAATRFGRGGALFRR